jgi:multiple sugar transport system permease protein
VFTQDVGVRTLPVGLSGLIMGDVYLWRQLMAASVLATLPVVIFFMFLHKYMVQGLTAGAVKG